MGTSVMGALNGGGKQNCDSWLIAATQFLFITTSMDDHDEEKRREENWINLYAAINLKRK